MCIILTCEKNVRPDYTLIEDCFYTNPDGAGIMWIEYGRVQTSKGFTDPQTLFNAIENTPIKSPLVIHMRIATSGGIDTGTCHPFPISSDLDILHAADVECDAAIAHNGIIRGVPTDKKCGISDTVYFTKEFLTREFKGKVTKRLKKKIKSFAPGNRFAIMTKDGKVCRIGDGWETVSNGIQASNGTWRYQPITFRSTYSGTYRLPTAKTPCGTYPYGDYGWDLMEEWYGNDPIETVTTDEYEDAYELATEYVMDKRCASCVQNATCRLYGPVCDDVFDAIDACADDILLAKHDEKEFSLI